MPNQIKLLQTYKGATYQSIVEDTIRSHAGQFKNLSNDELRTKFKNQIDNLRLMIQEQNKNGLNTSIKAVNGEGIAYVLDEKTQKPFMVKNEKQVGQDGHFVLINENQAMQALFAQVDTEVPKETPKENDTKKISSEANVAQNSKSNKPPPIDDALEPLPISNETAPSTDKTAPTEIQKNTNDPVEKKSEKKSEKVAITFQEKSTVTTNTDYKPQFTLDESKKSTKNIGPGLVVSSKLDATVPLNFSKSYLKNLYLTTGLEATQTVKFQPRFTDVNNFNETGIGTIHTWGANLGVTKKAKIGNVDLLFTANAAIGDKQRDDLSYSTSSEASKSAQIGIAGKFKKNNFAAIYQTKEVDKIRHIFGDLTKSTSSETVNLLQFSENYLINKNLSLGSTQSFYHLNITDSKGLITQADVQKYGLSINYNIPLGKTRMLANIGGGADFNINHNLPGNIYNATYNINAGIRIPLSP